jgi:hypothetical protein
LGDEAQALKSTGNQEEEMFMRSTLAAMLFAIGASLMVPTTASAAPVSGAAIMDAASSASVIEEAQYSRRRCRTIVRRVHRAGSRVRVSRVFRCVHRGRR